MLFPSIFLFSSKKKEKKPIGKKKNAKKGGSIPSNSCFALSLLVPVSTLMFQMLSP